MDNIHYRMTFFGSCGHVEVTEISETDFIKWTTEPGFSAIGQLPPNYWVGSSDGSAFMVYVYPGRYCTCQGCFKTSCDDGFL